jgi:uncharacterized protein (TIGR02996 family)
MIGEYRLTRVLDHADLWEYWLAEKNGRPSLLALLPRWHDEELRVQAPARFRARAALRHSRIPELEAYFVLDHPEHGYAAAYAYVPSVTFEEIASRGPVPPAIAARMIERTARLIYEARISPRWCTWAGLETSSLSVDPWGAVWWLVNPEIDPPMNVTGPGIVRRRVMEYMSPEAVRGVPLLPQSPVFSLGVILYRLVTGDHPFRADNIVQQFFRTMQGEYEPIANRANVPSEIVAILERALAPNPDDRHGHAGELADALNAVTPRVGEREVAELAVSLFPQLRDVELDGRDTVPSPPAATEEDRLLAAIESDRDSPDAYLVYADWLQSSGQVRGELIVLQAEASEARREAERLLLASNPALLGGLAELIGPSSDGPLFDAGPHFVGATSTGPLAIEWFMGFLRAARIVVDRGVDAHDVFARLESNESARFLRELTIGTMAPRDRSPHHILDQIYDAIASSRFDVRSLYVGDLGAGVAHTEHRNVSHVPAVFPKLERLALRGSRIRTGSLALPRLRELRVFSSGLETETLNQIASSILPELRSLELWFGGPPTRDAWPDRTRVVFESAGLPRLVELTISDPERDALPATLAILADTPLAARLERLRFVDGGIERAGRTLLALGDRFPRLEAVSAPPLAFSPGTEGALARRFTPSPRTSAPVRRARSDTGE